uniref:Uncharacterized protein n=1 Tax=Pristionchus pacificus TaxID=54126 RepID=A0A8R1UPG1_PRIPA
MQMCEDSQCGTICKEARLICPTFTEGTDLESAKLECRIWFIRGRERKYHKLKATPICRSKPGENLASFCLLLPSGEERAVSSRDSCVNHARNGGGVSLPYDTRDTIFAVFGGLSVAAFCGLLVVVFCWWKFKRNSSRRKTQQMSAVAPDENGASSD